MKSRNQAENYVDLRADRMLLDPNFDGYKLSLEQFPIYSQALIRRVHELQTSGSQYGLEHIKLFSDINHLTYDFFNSNEYFKRFYVILDDLRIYAIVFDVSANSFSMVETNVLIEYPPDFEQRQDRYPSTISFPDAEHVFIANGFGELVLYKTSDRADNCVWQECMRTEPLVNGVEKEAFTIIESRHIDNKFDVLLKAIVPKQGTGTKGNFCNKTTSASFICESGSIKQVETYSVICDGHQEMATYDHSSNGLIVVSSGDVKFCDDEMDACDQQMADMSKASGNSGSAEARKRYVWTQTSTDVTAVFNFVSPISKSDVNLSLSNTSVHFALGSCVLIGGTLGGAIEPSSSTYTIDNDRLELFLSKSNSLLWSELVVGDQQGTYEVDPSLMDMACEMLERFTSETQAIGESGCAKNFNVDQLEDCDANLDDVQKIRWLDVKSSKVTFESDISGHAFLFSTLLDSNTRHLCLRVDVDGILFSFTNDGKKVMHKATFNAFGYVQASKNQRRFSTCPPNCSYAAIIEAKRHAFVYWQPMNINCDLRNRKTGQKVADVAKQHLISLTKLSDCGIASVVSDNVVGVHADNNILFILTTADIYAVILRQ